MNFLKGQYRTVWKTAMLPIIDFVAILLSAWVVFVIRYNWFEGYFFGQQRISFSQYLEISIGISIGVVIVYAFLGLYEMNRINSRIRLFFRLTIGIVIVLLSLITFLFFNEFNRETLPEGVPVSRFILAVGGFIALYFVIIGRLSFWLFEQILYQFNIGRMQIALVGKDLDDLVSYFQEMPHISEVLRYPSLSPENYHDLVAKIQSHQISEIYLYGSNQPEESKLAVYAERYKINFVFTPKGFSDFQSFGMRPVLIKNKLFLELKHSNLDGWQIVAKRLFDIVFALVFIVSFSWLYLLIALAIKLDSPGSIFYLSKRVGPDGQEFFLYKFRRLKQEYCTTDGNQEAIELEHELIKQHDMRKDGILYKIKNDPRSTRVGRFIEKYSLDELPQFFNVLLGTMSVVGPRPHQPREVEKYQIHHYKVLNIKPGITGFGQINGRSDLTFEEEVAYDKFYIENWSFWMDVKIIARTPYIILFQPHNT